MTVRIILSFLILCLRASFVTPIPAVAPPVLQSYYQDSILERLESEAVSGPIDRLTRIRNILNFYVPLPRLINNTECKVAVTNFMHSLLNTSDPWALKMADSWGKIPDGVLFGNIHIVGMYEECIAIRATVEPLGDKADTGPIHFKGKYCKIYFEELETQNKLKSGPGIAVLLTPIPFYYATCIPSVCTEDDLSTSLKRIMSKNDRQVKLLDCHEEDVHKHATSFDGFDAFVCALLGLLIVLAIIGTIIDENNLQRFVKTPAGNLIMKKLTCFSLTKSFRSLFEYRTKSEGSITCLDGMRVITLIWIITCHQYETGLKFMVNTLDSSKYQDPYVSQLITDGYQSVDTFFTISGILLSYRLFPVILSGKHLSAKYYLKGFGISLFRRVVRLLPSIFVVATFSATLLRFIGFGPRNTALDTYAEECRDNWWKDPIFVNNLVHDGDSKVITEDDCLTHCWYTSVEMQLFLIAPLVFLPRIYDKLSGFIWLAFLTVMSQVIPLIVMLIYEFPPVLFPSYTIEENYDFYAKYYEVPWCRSAPWFIGIWTGIILVKYPHILRKITKWQVVLGYLIAIILGLVLVIGLYRYNHLDGDPNEIDNWVSGIYGFFSRPVWAICVSWVVVTCYTKNAWYVNAGLSWWGWQPLSRLTFCMYLLHPVVQVWWASTLYVPVYYSYLAKLFEITGVFFISFIFAVLLNALVEKPFLRLTENIASSRAIGINTSRQNSKMQETENS